MFPPYKKFLAKEGKDKVKAIYLCYKGNQCNMV